MKLLHELTKVARVDDDPRDDLSDLEDLHDEFADDELPTDSDQDNSDDSSEGDGPLEDQNDDQPEDDNELGDEDLDGLDDLDGAESNENAEPEDPDRAGLIRTVKKAHLIYKRQAEDGTYDELWIYNASSLSDGVAIRKAILAGTDIPPGRVQSPDGSQSYEMWTAGNAELVSITGLPQ